MAAWLALWGVWVCAALALGVIELLLPGSIFLGFALGGSVYIATAGAVHDIDDFRPPVAGLLQSGRAGIGPSVKDRNRDAAAVVSGVFLEIVQRAGLGLGQDALERKRLGAWRRGCGRLRLAKRDDGQAGQD